MTHTCQNIGPEQQRKRVRIAIASFAVAAVIGAWLIAVDAQRAWRLLALPPIWIGALGLTEARTRTCVVLAARGVRNMDRGEERVADAGERQALTRQSHGVHAWTLVLTILVTAALLTVP